MEFYDCVVVGAGVIGSATAYQLSRRGQNVLLLEQFFLPHNRGSSSGQSRIYRKAYNKVCYAEMMSEASEAWEEIEKEVGDDLHASSVGMLIVGKPTDTDVQLSQSTLDSVGVTSIRFSSEGLRQKYPSVRFDSDCVGLLDTTAGLLKAGKCIKALQDLVRKHGGKIRDGTQMTALRPGDDFTTIDTTGGTLRANKVIITAGPWAHKILQKLDLNLPVVPMRTPVMYWKSKDPDYHSVKNGFPVISYQNEHGLMYLIPSLEYPGLCKIAAHLSPPEYCDPDSRNSLPDKHIIDLVADFVREHLPGIEDKPSILEYCMYTESPDEDYIIDRHPNYGNIFIATGFSGHGFKLAPVVGKLLAEMATGVKTSYDITPFRIDRFSLKSKL